MIVTLTLNPALDVDTSTERVAPAEKLRCADPLLHPGGGGINVARVVTRLGGDVVAVCTSGGATGAVHRSLLEAEGVRTVIVPVAGETRQSFTVDERSTGEQYRFLLPGPSLDAAEWQACVTALESRLGAGDVLVLSGSLPPGVPDDAYARLATVARERDALSVVDASGPALKHAVDGGVDVIKPSRSELEALVGHQLKDAGALESAAHDLVDSGRVRMVALTLGAEGAVVVDARGTARGSALPVALRTTVGAGDSFLGGLLVRLDADAEPAECLRWALACAASAVSSHGTGLISREQVEGLLAT